MQSNFKMIKTNMLESLCHSPFIYKAYDVSNVHVLFYTIYKVFHHTSFGSDMIKEEKLLSLEWKSFQ